MTTPTIIWEGILEKKGRGFLYRPWVTREFRLLSSQVLEYYRREEKYAGSINMKNATISSVDPQAADGRTFPFIIVTIDGETVFLNASTNEIRQKCIRIFSAAAQNKVAASPPRNPSTKVTSSGSKPTTNTVNPQIPSASSTKTTTSPLKPPAVAVPNNSPKTSSTNSPKQPPKPAPRADPVILAPKITSTTALMRKEVLKGGVYSSQFPIKDWKRITGRLITFVSSTFTDTHRERDFLMKKLLPKLSQLGNSLNLEVSLVDMRWGVSDENTSDHLTWLTCEEEIERCYEQSMGLFFLSLQSQKYGYCPLPKYIPADVIERVLPNLSEDDVKCFHEWYHLDENALPKGRYVLTSLTAENASIFWSSVKPRLLPLLEGYEFDHKLIIGHSVTEYEFRKAAKLCHKDVGDRMAWFSRYLSDVEGGNRDYEYDDCIGNPSMSQKMQRVKDYMNSFFDAHFPAQRFLFTSSSYSDYLDQNSIWQEQFRHWCINMEKIFLKSVTELVDVMKDWRDNGCGMGLPGHEVDEMLHHCEWASMKCSSFFGREDLLENAFLLYQKEREAKASGTPSPSIALALVGSSGSGKTAFMSKLASSIYKRERYDGENAKTLPVIIRFGGTSEGSLRVLTLLINLCHHIHFLMGVAYNTRNLSLNYYEQFDSNVLESEKDRRFNVVLSYWASLLVQFPHVLFIDSLDQIKDESNERSRRAMLQAIPVGCPSIIIVSTIPQTVANGSSGVQSGNETESMERVLREWKIPIFSIPTRFAQPTELLQKILEDHQRRLTPMQWGVVRKALEVDSSVLYIQLSKRVILNWTTFQSSAEELQLAPGIKQIISQIFDNLERLYGREFTRAAVAAITAPITIHGGITEADLLEILSIDQTVMQAITQYNKTDRFPYHVWWRLKSELKDYLVETERGKLRWYHRQVTETLTARYAKDIKNFWPLYSEFRTLLAIEIDGDRCRGSIQRPNGQILIFQNTDDSNKRVDLLSMLGTSEATRLDYYPEEVLAREILWIKREAERAVGYKIKECFVLIPSFLNLFQRAAVADAIELCGLQLNRIRYTCLALPSLDLPALKVDNKIRTYIHYGESCMHFMIALVDDEFIEVLECAHSIEISGKRVTEKLYDYVLKKARKQYKTLEETLSRNKANTLLLACRKARDVLFLPGANRAVITIPGQFEYTIEVQKDEFHHEILESFHDEFYRMVEVMRTIVHSEKNRIFDEVRHSGAFFYHYHPFQMILKEKFPQIVIKPSVNDKHPTEHAIFGAAMDAKRLSNYDITKLKVHNDDYLLLLGLDLPYAIAIESTKDETLYISDTPTKSDDKTVLEVIAKGTLPIRRSFPVSVTSAEQSSFLIRIYEKTNRHSIYASENLLLKQIRISDVQSPGIGKPTINIGLEIGFMSYHHSPKIMVYEASNDKLLSVINLSRSNKYNINPFILSKLKLHLTQEEDSLMMREVTNSDKK